MNVEDLILVDYAHMHPCIQLHLLAPFPPSHSLMHSSPSLQHFGSVPVFMHLTYAAKLIIVGDGGKGVLVNSM